MKHRTAAALGVGLTAVLASAGALVNGFAYDDLPIVAENTDIHSPATLPGAVLDPYWPGPRGRELGLWRPLTTGALGLQWQMWGGSPLGFHATNVLLCGVVATLLFVLISGHVMSPSAAFAAGLLFAAHPVHVEAVANVVGLSELLSAVFFLLACIVVARRPEPGAMTAGPVVVVALLYLLALLSKESAAGLPGAVLAVDACRRNGTLPGAGPYLRDRGALYTAMGGVAALVLAARFHVLGSLASASPPLGAEVLAEGGVPRIWTVLSTWPEIVRLFAFPLRLSADYAPAVIPLAHGWTSRNVLGLAAGLATLGCAWLSWRRGGEARAVAFGVLWFGAAYLPASNLLFLTGTLLAERTLFLPSAGFAAATGWLVDRFRRRRPRAGVLLLVLATGLLFGRAVARAPAWKDNQAVFSTLLRDQPRSGRAQWVAGDLYLEQSEHARALAAYGSATRLLGGSYALRSAAGRRLLAAGLDGAGEQMLRGAWRDQPRIGDAPARLAALYDRQGRWVEAEAAARAALAAGAGSVVQGHLLARALASQGRHAEAAEARRAVIRSGEDRWQQWAWLAEAEFAAGRFVEALDHLDSARVRTDNAQDVARIDSIRAQYRKLLREGDLKCNLKTDSRSSNC